jgi:surface polysaccharide O-acyltransferase-like enzyme
MNNGTMTNDELLSRTISYLRFPLCVGVVFIHFELAKGLAIHGVKYGLDNPDWYFFIMRLINDVIARISVPLFFIISGFLFFYREEFSVGIYKKKLKIRALTLLVPYLLWNFIAVLWKLKCFLPIVSSYYRQPELKITLMRIVNTFLFNSGNRGIILGSTTIQPLTGVYPIDLPLWFVRDLMLMIIFSPIIYWFIRSCKVWFVIIAGFVWFLFSLLFPNEGNVGLYAGQLLCALFFFSWGALYSINKTNFVISFRKLYYAPLVYLPIAIVDAHAIGVEGHDCIHNAGILFGVVAVVNTASYLLESGKVKVNYFLANSSFFIFALHYLFIGEFGRIVFVILHVPDNNPYAMLILYFTISFISILVCLGLYAFLKRYMPGLCNLLTGGR